MSQIKTEGKINEAKRPLISVAMPVYNGEKYLGSAVESILTQTFDDFEFIIIDDGSTDGSLGLLREYQKSDSRIRLYSRENRGFSNTVNEIIDLSRGDWVARMDQDDVAVPFRFERQLQRLQETDADLCGSWIQYFGAGDRRIWKTFETDAAIKLDMLFKSPLAHPTVFLKSELIKKLRYDSKWDKAEDYELWVRASIAGWKMTNVQEVLLLYRRHHEQISTKTGVKQKTLTGTVQNRYWTYVLSELGIVSEVNQDARYKIYLDFESNQSVVELAIEKLLKQSKGESLLAISQGVARLSYEIAADHPLAVNRLSRLMKMQGVGFSLRTKFALKLLSIFKIRSDGWVFGALGKIYSYLYGSSRI